MYTTTKTTSLSPIVKGMLTLIALLPLAYLVSTWSGLTWAETLVLLFGGTLVAGFFSAIRYAPDGGLLSIIQVPVRLAFQIAFGVAFIAAALFYLLHLVAGFIG